MGGGLSLEDEACSMEPAILHNSSLFHRPHSIFVIRTSKEVSLFLSDHVLGNRMEKLGNCTEGKIDVDWNKDAGAIKDSVTRGWVAIYRQYFSCNRPTKSYCTLQDYRAMFLFKLDLKLVPMDFFILGICKSIRNLWKGSS